MILEKEVSTEMTRKDAPTRRDFLVTAGIGTAALLTSGARQRNLTGAEAELKLWYRQPAPDWNEALPIGNGRLGAMIFGGIETEHLQLNENTLYSDEPGRRDINLDVTKEFEQVVKMLRNRQHKEATDLITARLVGRAQPCYQPMGDLHFYFENCGEVTDYTRELDLATAISAVRYKQGGVIFTREFFASHPEEVIVIRLSADRPQSLNFRAAFSSVHPTAKTRAAGTDVIRMTGQVPGFALRRELDFVEKRSDQWLRRALSHEQGGRQATA